MERFQTVNGDKGTIGTHPTGMVDLTPPGFEDSDAAPEAELGPSAAIPGSHGTCLYLGARGERCRRPALASRFCTRHFSVDTTPPGMELQASAAEADQIPEDPRKRALKLLISLLGLIFLLGPIFTDAARAFLAMLRNN
jgi:hypothetical protein